MYRVYIKLNLCTYRCTCKLYLFCLFISQSPFPEERGYVVPLKETQRINQLSEVKMSLSFSGAEKASPALKNSPLLSPPDQSANEQGSYSSFAAGLKPSNVVELQKHVSPPTRQQNLTKTGNKNRNNLSTGIQCTCI